MKYLLLIFLFGCGYDVNSDPHRKGKYSSSGTSYSPSYESVFCESSVAVSPVGDYEHQHSPVALSLSEVNKAEGGSFRLLSGGHSHTFYLSGEHMGNILRKREVIVVDKEGHSHNISLKCLR